MSEDSLSRWFRTLQPLELVEVLRDFLGAEANRVDGSTGDVHFSTAITVGDGGVDGRTSLPISARSLFLPGPRTWQVKSGRDAGIGDVDKPETQKALAAGRDYVLCWTGDDPITPKVDNLLETLRSKVKEKYQDRTADIITVPDLVRMASAYPSVVYRHNGPAPLGLSLEQWGRHLNTGDYPFVADEQRERLLETLRNFSRSTGARATHIHVVGDTGVGKSRLVYEALELPGLRATVIVAPEYSYVNLEGLKHAALPEGAHLVLVVDDATGAQIESLRIVASAVAGRLRLITIGDRGEYRYISANPTRLDLAPLPNASMHELLGAQGLSNEATALVERMAQGYPRLAVELARALRDSGEANSMIELLAQADVHSLLRRMIPSESLRESLSSLALFDRVGVDDELSSELDAVAHHFNVDRLALRTAITEEADRFISSAGRYRRVTPLALAVWLVREFIRSKPTAVVDAVSNLPDSLTDAFHRQLEVLGGDPTIENVLEEVARRQAPRFRGLSGQLNYTGASFLHALSYGTPELAARLFDDYLGDANENVLRAQEPGVRRRLVWGLSHLLWFAATFNTALSLLFRLAMAETENFSNNATGEFTGAFQLQLGGTEVPFNERLEWWDRASRGASTAHLLVLTDALAAGLQERETRAGGWRGGRFQPEEWKPRTVADVIEARRAVWDRLLNIGHTDNSELLGKVVNVAKLYIRDLVRYPFMSEVLDELMSLKLSPGQRASLADGLRNALRFDMEDEPQDPKVLKQYIDELLGKHLSPRLLTVLATPAWDLDDRFYEREPDTLVALANELLEANDDDSVAHLRRALHAPESHSQTQYSFGVVLGRRDSAHKFEALIDEEAVGIDFTAGYLRGISESDSDHVERILDAWLAAGKYEAVLGVTSFLPATSLRARRAVDAARSAERAGKPAIGLARLAFGSWLAPLHPQEAAQVIERLIEEAEQRLDFNSIDAAAFAAETYIDRQKHPDSDLLALGRRALVLTMRNYAGHGRDLTYLRNRLADRIQLSPEDRLTFTLRALEKERFVEQDDLVALRQVMPQLGENAIDVIFEWLMRLPFRIDIYIQHAKVVSLLIDIFGENLVSQKILRLPIEAQESLMAHIDWNEDVPTVGKTLLAENELRDEASRRFLYPDKVIRGPYSLYLESRRDILSRLEQGETDPHVRDWARELLPVMDQMIVQARVREEEEER